MPSLTIKNIPDALYEELKLAAQNHRRSINSEVIMLLEERLVPQKPSRKELEERAADCLEMNRKAGLYVTEDEIDEAINQGRP